MAIYYPDNNYIKGKKLLEELKGEEGELIRYYVSENERQEKLLRERMVEMQEVFNGIKKFAR